MNTIERVYKTHSDEHEAVKDFTHEAQKGIGKKWLGVFVTVEEDGSLLIARTTWEFPQDRFLEAVAVLAENLAKEPVPDAAATAGEFTGDDFQALQDMLRKRREELADSPATIPLRDDDPVHVSQEDIVTESLNSKLNAAGGFARESLEVHEVKANIEEDKS